MIAGITPINFKSKETTKPSVKSVIGAFGGTAIPLAIIIIMALSKVIITL